MTTIAIDYVSLDVTGRDLDDYDRLLEIERHIHAILGRDVGYQTMRLDSERAISEQLREPADVLEASGGRLPVILVNLTFRDGEVAQTAVDELVRLLALRLVARSTFPDR